MTQAQARQIMKLALQIEALASKSLDVLNDDPMHGDVWTAVNNVSAACDWVREEARKNLPAGVGR